MEREWPARSPDLSPLDFWFWSVALAELRRNPPATLLELQTTVDAFARGLKPEDIRQVVRHVCRRAEICLRRNGASAEN